MCVSVLILLEEQRKHFPTYLSWRIRLFGCFRLGFEIFTTSDAALIFSLWRSQH